LWRKIKRTLRHWFASPRKKKYDSDAYHVLRIRRDGDVFVKEMRMWINPQDDLFTVQGAKLIFPHNRFYKKGRQYYSRRKIRRWKRTRRKKK